MLPKQVITLGDHKLVVEVARTAAERARGLSGRNKVPDGTGMLFVFPQPGFHSFWMKDTRVPLVIYWLNYAGRVMEASAMMPGELRTFSPTDYASHALEVPLSWASTHKVRVGDKIAFALKK